METGIILGILFAIIVLLVIFYKKKKVNNSFWQIQIPTYIKLKNSLD